MAIETVPDWMAELDWEDVSFIRNFVLASGSLKEIAQEYGVRPIRRSACASTGSFKKSA